MNYTKCFVHLCFIFYSDESEPEDINSNSEEDVVDEGKDFEQPIVDVEEEGAEPKEDKALGDEKGMEVECNN